jgi:uncharacterized protein (DUF2267 family)
VGSTSRCTTPGTAQTFGPDEFVERGPPRRRARTGTARLGEARAVLAVLAEHVDETTMAAVRRQLGPEYARLLAPDAQSEDVMAPGFLPDLELPRI